MESQPKAEPSPFQKFDALTKKIMSVPKSEIDKRAHEAKKQRGTEKHESR